MKRHTVSPGECMASIAYANGFFWETLWNDPKNAALKALRGDPNVLLPGDEVYIPDLTQRKVQRPTTQRHKFRLKGVPAFFNVRLMKDDVPRPGLRYELVVDEAVVARSSTDADGWIKHPIPPDARSGVLRVTNEEGEQEAYTLELGHLDPIDTISGVQGRLRSLGCFEAAVDGAESPALAAAILRFQRDSGMAETGAIDDALRDALQKAHGS